MTIYKTREQAQKSCKKGQWVVKTMSGYVAMYAKEYDMYISRINGERTCRPTKEYFTKRIMTGLADRESERKEEEAQAMIEQPCGYYSEKTYSHGKKYTKQAFQC